MTDAERALWQRLRFRQVLDCRFRRQRPLGQFIADFVCLERMLVIEVDGGQHAEMLEQDAKRTRWLESQGYRVLRFWDNQVLKEIDGVLEVVVGALQAPPP